MTRVAFRGPIVEWRGPPPFTFVAVPDHCHGEVREAARFTSYGWGCVAVAASVDGHTFTTALMPRQGTYMLPVKAAVRRATGIGLGDEVDVTITIG